MTILRNVSTEVRDSGRELVFFSGEEPRNRRYGRTAALRPLVQPCDEDGGMKLAGENRSTRRKTCPSATLSTTNPTWTDLGSEPGLRGGRQAANRLSHGTGLGNWLP
jgi:hypothetical protein